MGQNKEITVVVTPRKQEVSDEVLHAYDTLFSGFREIFESLNNAVGGRVKISFTHKAFDKIFKSRFAICVNHESGSIEIENDTIEFVYMYVHEYVSSLSDNNQVDSCFGRHVTSFESINSVKIDDSYLHYIFSKETSVRNKFSGLSDLKVDIYRNWNPANRADLVRGKSSSDISSSHVARPDQADLFRTEYGPDMNFGGNGLEVDSAGDIQTVEEHLTYGLVANIRNTDFYVGLTCCGRLQPLSRSLSVTEEICRRINQALEGVELCLAVKISKEGQVYAHSVDESMDLPGS